MARRSLGKGHEGFRWEAMARQVAPDLYEKNNTSNFIKASLASSGSRKTPGQSHHGLCLMPIQAAGVHRREVLGLFHSQACLGALPGGFVSEVALQYCQHDLGHDPETVSNPW